MASDSVIGSDFVIDWAIASETASEMGSECRCGFEFVSTSAFGLMIAFETPSVIVYDSGFESCSACYLLSP
jgi:hypothetical protein